MKIHHCHQIIYNFLLQFFLLNVTYNNVFLFFFSHFLIHRSMQQWQGNLLYYKVELNTGHCYQVVIIVVAVVVLVEGASTSSSSSLHFYCRVAEKRKYIYTNTYFTSFASSFTSPLNVLMLQYQQQQLYVYSKKALYIHIIVVGRIYPTLMGCKPITSGDSYDVIRGGHRQFWLVRR